MKTYKCKTEIYVEVQAENESDALLKVGNYGTDDLPNFYWEVEQVIADFKPYADARTSVK